MIPVLIFIRPLDLSTGARVDVRLGSASDATALGLNGVSWEPAIARRPRIAQDLFSPDLDGKFKLAAADFVIAQSLLRGVGPVNRLYFPGAPVVIYSAADMAWSRVVVEFAGLVSTAPPDLDANRLTLNCTVDRTRIDKPLLTGEFSGAGGVNGDAAVRGTLYPYGAGFVECVEWVLFDTTNNIGMLDGYGNLQSVQTAFEGLNDLGASVGDYATYAALKDAITNKSVPRGRWATCLAQGMVGLGAPPVGRITFNATFARNRTGAIINRILSQQAGLAAADFDAAAFTAIDAIVDREVRFYSRDQIQISDLIEAMALPLNTTPLITVQNRISITRVAASPPIATLDRGGSRLPAVINWRIAEPIEPTYRIVYRAERPETVLSYSEVNYVDTIIDRGAYSATEVYRAGHLVWLIDKSSWLYQNSTPAAGHAPPSTQAPDANGQVFDAWWVRQQPPTNAAAITYASGQTMESLKPSELGANITEYRVAAAITAQGAFATKNSAAYGSPLLTGFGQLSPFDAIRFGGNKNNYAGFLAEDNSIATDSGYRTANGTAAAISAQGALATANSADYDTQIAGLPAGLGKAQMLYYGGQYYLAASGIAWSQYDTASVESTRPAERGANVTEYRVAAAISAQGALATKNQTAAADIAPSAVQLVTYQVLQNSVNCPVGN